LAGHIQPLKADKHQKSGARTVKTKIVLWNSLRQQPCTRIRFTVLPLQAALAQLGFLQIPISSIHHITHRRSTLTGYKPNSHTKHLANQTPATMDSKTRDSRLSPRLPIRARPSIASAYSLAGTHGKSDGPLDLSSGLRSRNHRTSSSPQRLHAALQNQTAPPTFVINNNGGHISIIKFYGHRAVRELRPNRKVEPAGRCSPRCRRSNPNTCRALADQ
jgi:hypothetical protein